MLCENYHMVPNWNDKIIHHKHIKLTHNIYIFIFMRNKYIFNYNNHATYPTFLPHWKVKNITV